MLSVIGNSEFDAQDDAAWLKCKVVEVCFIWTEKRLIGQLEE